MTQESLIGVEHAANGVTTLTMRSRGKLTVITTAFAQEFARALDALAARDELRAVVLRSAGPAFCAGGDLGAIRDALADPPRLLGAVIDAFHELILAMRRLPVPIVGAMQGSAAGGGYSLALACDLLVAARSARFVAAYPALGTSSDGGLSHFLGRRLGLARAMDLILLRGTLPAPEALELGLVTRVVEDAQLDAAAQAMAQEIAAQAPQSVREFKRLLIAREDPDLGAQLQRERDAFVRCAQTADFRRRVEAFLARR